MSKPPPLLPRSLLSHGDVRLHTGSNSRRYVSAMPAAQRGRPRGGGDVHGLVDGRESFSGVSDSLQPHGRQSPRDSPGQNPGVGSLSLLQGIFPTQGLKPGLPHCRRILYQLSHQGSPHFAYKGAVMDGIVNTYIN